MAHFMKALSNFFFHTRCSFTLKYVMVQPVWENKRVDVGMLMLTERVADALSDERG